MKPYSHLPSSLIDIGGFNLHIPVRKLIDLLDQRAKILAEEAATPGLPPSQTELVRGRRAECLTFLKVLQDAEPTPRETVSLSTEFNLVPNGS